MNMNCRKPFRDFGCGQCIPCRISKRRVWTYRIMLESLLHSDNCFATLTYEDSNVPTGNTLNPRHLQLFLKRLRLALSEFGISIRYYSVGEYGDETQRPHYHLAIFGLPPTATELVLKAWGKGHIMLGDLSIESAQYIAGYVTKKMTSWHDPRLNGRHPEFARMSLKPGIGAGAIKDISASLLSTDAGFRMLVALNDVPHALNYGSKMMPLGRYLKGKLRHETGMLQDLSNYHLDKWKREIDLVRANKDSQKMLVLQENFLRSKASSSKSFTTYMLEMKQQKILNIESRYKSRNRGKSL